VKDIDSSRYPDAAVIASFSRKLGPERFSFVAEEVLPCFIMESGQPHSYHHVSIIYGNIADAEIYRAIIPRFFSHCLCLFVMSHMSCLVSNNKN